MKGKKQKLKLKLQIIKRNERKFRQRLKMIRKQTTKEKTLNKNYSIKINKCANRKMKTTNEERETRNEKT